MTEKKALTDEELLAQFADIPAEEPNVQGNTKGQTAKAPATTTAAAADADDVLAELQTLATARPTSRPATPKISKGEAASRGASARTSEDKSRAAHVSRKSADSGRSFHQGFTPAQDATTTSDANKSSQAPAAEETEKQQSGGGWWGGLYATASAAVKQAETAVKEIQKNEEAQRWAEQVKGNVGALRGLGGELRSRALPTFTNLLHTLAPPISQHERLQIHITHDLIGYPSLDPIIYQTFSRVMAQVEGGDLMVIQRGSESSHRRGPELGGGSSAWNDGPWWRQTDVKRDIGAVKGLVEGTKLVRVSAESYANEFFASRGGVEEAAKQATEVLSETNPVRSSDIFLAIQAINHTSSEDLFVGAGTEGKAKTGGGGVDEPKEVDELFCFALLLHDPIHGIDFRTVTQSIPQKWVEWMDASPPPPASDPRYPEEIMDIIHSGGVDPREWVSEWLEEILSLGIGVVAQRYVARRMGVGEGGIGRGKAREQAVDSGAGEAARAL